MKRVTVIYGTPTDPAKFDKYFHDIHVPLVLKMPHLQSFQVSKGKIDGTDYHLVAQLTYKTQGDLEASMGSPEGKAVVADVPNYATGTVQMLTYDVAELA